MRGAKIPICLKPLAQQEFSAVRIVCAELRSEDHFYVLGLTIGGPFCGEWFIGDNGIDQFQTIEADIGTFVKLGVIHDEETLPRVLEHGFPHAGFVEIVV